MNYRIGDEVTVRDGSYSFGVQNGEYSGVCGGNNIVYRVVEKGLGVMKNYGRDTSGEYRQQCDLLLIDDDENFVFTQSRFCEPANRKIEIKYFRDDEDVTDQISETTKRNLRG